MTMTTLLVRSLLLVPMASALFTPMPTPAQTWPPPPQTVPSIGLSSPQALPPATVPSIGLKTPQALPPATLPSIGLKTPHTFPPATVPSIGAAETLPSYVPVPVPSAGIAR
ncbi:MAG TPA: hypothetical protein VFV05_09910 [Methylomirabilota bacterium]|nr:hypothetical protein [Methylomirabilota bacterium]